MGDQPLVVRSTTIDPLSAAAFAIFPRFDPDKDRPPCAVHGRRGRNYIVGHIRLRKAVFLASETHLLSLTN
jgi:hypothetical protein